jgi:hypothetical protein
VSKSHVITNGNKAIVNPIFLRAMIVDGRSDIKMIPNIAAEISARKLGARREPGKRITDKRHTKKNRIKNGN